MSLSMGGCKMQELSSLIDAFVLTSLCDGFMIYLFNPDFNLNSQDSLHYFDD